MPPVRTPNGRFEFMPHPPIRRGAPTHLEFRYVPESPRPGGMHLWLFMDIRQDPGIPQVENPNKSNFVSASTSDGKHIPCRTFMARTLDLYPSLPEFLYVCELTLLQDLSIGQEIILHLGLPPGEWQAPQHPIHEFRFWLLESGWEHLEFTPTGYKNYHTFNTPQPENLQKQLATVIVSIEGELPMPASTLTKTSFGIAWGDLHGMAFNQRPLDDYYHYAREIAKLDFAAALLFSYNTCVDGMWQAVKDAASRWTKPGEFLAVAGFEAGTPPDGSHRNAYFFDHRNVPPIFCEDRPPALDIRLQRRFHPDTIICTTLDQYDKVVAHYGGIVTGHFHTWQYRKEVLAEIWQKQVGLEGDESRIFDLLNRGYRFGIVGGSDTHDSRPGNQLPEPYCPQTAGMMAVLTDSISSTAIKDAILQRHVYATSGARIGMKFAVDSFSMGSVLPYHTRREFSMQVSGTSLLERVELIRNGRIIWRSEPKGALEEANYQDESDPASESVWYLLRVCQEDGHRAWSSPIWFEGKECR